MKIYSSAPTRIGILGGGTDIPTYSDKFGGLCLNMAINIRQHFELTDANGKDNVYPKGANPKFYEEFYKQFAWTPETCVSTFDGILESGLGSSASAAVALVGALSRYNKMNLTREQIAEKAWGIEVNKIGLYGGRQDQYASVFGGCNLFEFGARNITKNGWMSTSNVKVTRLDGFIEKILPSLTLFYIGNNRKSAKIQEGFKNLSFSQEERLHNIKDSVLEGSKIITTGDIEKFGKFMDRAWQMKKISNKGVSNEEIDEIYSKALKFGAFGGKIMGAGGGGCMLLVVDPSKREKFIQDMGLEWIDFSIDYNGLSVRQSLR